MLVVDGEDDFVPARDGDECESHAGVAGGAFNNRAARLQDAAALGIVNHPFADAIFHGAAGIHVIGLHVDFGLEAFREAIEPNEGRAAHGFEDVIALHVRVLVLRRTENTA